jgi:hypothetical protein
VFAAHDFYSAGRGLQIDRKEVKALLNGLRDRQGLIDRSNH